MLGRYLMSTVWLFARDLDSMKRFYRDALGLRMIEEWRAGAHFDAGNIRVSLHEARPGGTTLVGGSFLVFYVEDGIDQVYDALRERGVKFKTPPKDESFGRATSFEDPEGHELWLWQPPALGTKEYEDERLIVELHERLAAKLKA